MTRLSLRLSHAIAQGRTTPSSRPNRAALLAILLRKRAAAHNIGAPGLEKLLRDQIRWSLPIHRETQDI